MSGFDSLTQAAAAADNLSRTMKVPQSLHAAALSAALLEYRGEIEADILDTAGATLGQLETQVNLLKAVLRRIGAIDTV